MLNTKNSAHPHSVSIYSIWFSQWIAIILPHTINWGVFLVETYCALCEIWTKPLHRIRMMVTGAAPVRPLRPSLSTILHNDVTFNCKVLLRPLRGVQHQDWLTDHRQQSDSDFWQSNKSLHFAHKLFSCVPCNSHSKQPLFPCAAFTDCCSQVKWLVWIFRVLRVFDYIAPIPILRERGKCEIGGSCIMRNLEFLTHYQAFLGW